jgi:hypothetical protein
MVRKKMRVWRLSKIQFLISPNPTSRMKLKSALLTILFSLLFVACLPQPNLGPPPTEMMVLPSATIVQTITVVPTAAPTATVVKAAAALPTGSAVPQVTSEPTATPPAVPGPEIDPYDLARQILEQSEFAAAGGWLVAPCEGEAAVLCISNDQGPVGYAELLIYPLSGYAADHPLRLAAADLPEEAAEYTADHFILARQALVALAEDHLEITAADRAITFPDDTFTSLGQQPTQMGALPALAFGFVHTNEQGAVQERYFNVAAFDQQFLYWFGINYDLASFSGFVSDAALSQFEPFFHQIAAGLPIHQPKTADNQSLSPLPPFTSYSEQNGELPSDVTWVLATDLPQGAAAVTVLSQPAQTEPLTAEQANRIAITYGFNGPLYVEARPGLSVNDAADLGMFVAFDGARTLSLAGMPYSYSDISNWHQGLDLPFDEAAPIAERFLRAKGWLTFPYIMAESTQGEGVLFQPILEGVQLLSPAYGVRVAGNGQVSDVSIYPLDTLTPAGDFPIMTASMAWEALEKDLNQSGIFYRVKQPAVETTAVASPIEYSKFPSVQQEGEFYTNIWAYRPLSGDFPPVVRSIEFVRIAGDADMLNELVEKSDYLLHLWGRVDRPAAGLRELTLSNWEAIEDAGGLPMFFGTIRQDGYQTFLEDEANHTNYFLPDAPAELEAGNYVAVSGLPETTGDMEQLLWQKITVYPPQPGAVPQPTVAAIQTINIGSVKLVYLPQPASVTGLSDNLFIPAWEFAGVADNGAYVTVWVTAVSPEYIAK